MVHMPQLLKYVLYKHLNKHQQHDAWYAQHPRHQGVGGVDAEREVEKAADEVENKEQHQPREHVQQQLEEELYRKPDYLQQQI